MNFVDNIKIEGLQFLDQAMKSGRGVIGLTAHFGNFILLSWRLSRLGYSAYVMARPMRDEKVGDYFQALRDRLGIKTILSYPRRDCVKKTIEVLRQNSIVVIPMDQNFGTGGVWVKFFNKLAATPIGPVVFALRTKAVVLPMFVTSEPAGKHNIKILPPLDIEIREDNDETILVNVINFSKVIEKQISQA